jgi:hypothetical protein
MKTVKKKWSDQDPVFLIGLMLYSGTTGGSAGASCLLKREGGMRSAFGSEFLYSSITTKHNEKTRLIVFYQHNANLMMPKCKPMLEYVYQYYYTCFYLFI